MKNQVTHHSCLRLYGGVFSALLLAIFGPISVKAQSGQEWHGHVPDAVAGLKPLEDLAPTTTLQLAVGLPLRNKAVLTNLIRDLYDPASPKFHRYLTTDQFTDQFGPTPGDHQKLIDFLQSHGLNVTGTNRNRMVVTVTAAVKDIEEAFHVHMRVYQHPTEDRTFYSPDTAPWIDAGVPVVDVAGLDNYFVPHRVPLQRRESPGPKGTPVQVPALQQGKGLDGTYLSADLREAYAPDVANTGTGQYIAVYSTSPYHLGDINTYEGYDASLPTSTVMTVPPSEIGDVSYYESYANPGTVLNICMDGLVNPAAPGTDCGEEALDIEMCIAMAPGTTILYYASPVGDHVFNQIASDNLAKQITMSYTSGAGFDATAEQDILEFAAQGQAFFQSSGDTGAYSGTLGPGLGNPYITIVGGTILNTVVPGGKWQSETAGSGSGGGVSSWAIPNWQEGVDMAAVGGSSAFRNFPDVAMVMQNLFCAINTDPGNTNVDIGEQGGTSCSSPLWAGFYALANQQAFNLGKPPLGFFNPALYALGQSANYNNCFHDITSGNNTNNNSPNNFFAAPGYDLCTGWGSPNGMNLINALTGIGLPSFMLYVTPATLTVTAGGGATVLVTQTPMNGFSGRAPLSVSGLPADVTYQLIGDPFSGSIFTFSAGLRAVPGTYAVTLSGEQNGVTQTTTLTLVIVAATPGTSEVNLNSAFNRTAIYNDGDQFSGGADAAGNAYSANLIGLGLVGLGFNWNGCLFTEGPNEAKDVVSCVGQNITLPSGKFTSLVMLATAVNDNQTWQPFTVHYTDGSASVFVQSLSGWWTPQNYPGESVVEAMPYRDNGTTAMPETTEIVNVYGYSFSLDNTKMVASIDLPDNGNVLVFAMTLANDFTLDGYPRSFVLTAGGEAACYLTMPLNGLNGNVSWSVSGLPSGVTASFNPGASSGTSILTLTASPTAAPSNATLSVTGMLSGLTRNLSLNLSVITPIPCAMPVPLSSYYNLLSGIATDGATFSASDGLDGTGNAYSSTFLTSAPNWDGCLFSLGPPNGLDAVTCSGQTIMLPAGQYTGLLLLAANINGTSQAQDFIIHYTDGSTVLVRQYISDWTDPQNYPGESVAFATAYCDTSTGTANTLEPVNLYGYVLPLSDTATVESVTLPNHPNVIILGMTLANVSAPVSLTSAFTAAGIYTDGTQFSAADSLDGMGNAYSSTQLGLSPIWDSVQFNLGPANNNDFVSCQGQEIQLAGNQYTTLLMLATGVNGDQLSQSFTVTYTDGTTESTMPQNFSDWVGLIAYPNQFIAASMPYRLNSGGGQDESTNNLFGYMFPLNNTKTVQSLKLPSDQNLDILAVQLANTPLPVSLQPYFNLTGIYTDGTNFGSQGGLDGGGYAFSANLLSPSQTWQGMLFNFGLPNQNNVVNGGGNEGQPIPLPPGRYSALLMLATCVNGSQANQLFTVNYIDGLSDNFPLSMSDWAYSRGYPDETVVVPMNYRDNSGGGQDGPSVNLYGYYLPLNDFNIVQSITLPINSDVEVLAITLLNCTDGSGGPPGPGYVPPLGPTHHLEGPFAGNDSFVLPATATWTASANDSWLHLALTNGTGSTNVVFSYDANTGATRTGSLTIAGQTLTITQTGSTYVQAPGPLTALVSSNLNSPFGLAVDGAGNVYIADELNNAVKEWIAANNTVITLVSTNLSNPTGVAVDASGNVYIADYGNNAVKEWIAANNTVATLFSNVVGNPYGVALDTLNNVYVADWGDDAVKEWTVANSNVITLVSSAHLNGPTSVSVDAAGNVYISDYFDKEVKEWMAANSNVVSLFTPLSGGGPNGLAVDGAGNIYVADEGNNAIEKWTAANRRLTTLVASGLNTPQKVVVDGTGDLYIADRGNNAIKELPYAFVNPTPRLESLAAGSDALPMVLPCTANLLPPFAPASDQSWLTISGVADGVVSFAFTSTATNRTARITLLGQTIPVTQASPPPPTLMGAAILGNGEFQLSFSNIIAGTTFTILSTTNLSLPLTNWTVVGTATNTAPGLLQFTDTEATNSTRFYTVRSP